MIRTLVVMTSAAMLVASPALAAPCKDTKGKFIKCPPAVAKVATTGGVTKDKNGKCHLASGPKKGQFVKCP